MRKIIPFALALTLPFLLPVPAHPATRAPLGDAVAGYLAPLLQMRDFSGSVLIAHHGRILVNRGYGFANFELAVPATASTRYAIGSVSKTFTAAAVLLLAERGQVTLGDEIGKLLPGLPWGGQVTIKHLLEHTGGVPDYYVLPDFAARRSQPVSLAEFTRWIGTKPLDFAPGTKSNYSNSGYVLLAAIIEKVSGQPYPLYLRRNIFDPLKMSSTGDLSEAGVTDRLATGYDPGFPPARLQRPVTFDPGWLLGCGSIYSTTGDLLRWAEAVRHKTLIHDDRFPATYGWGLRQVFNRRLLEQNGRLPLGYTSFVGLYPDDDLVVITLSNLQVDLAERIGHDLAAAALGVPYARPELRREVPVDPARMAEYAGRYEIAPGFVLAVRADGGRLALAGPEGDYLPLEAESDTRFLFRALYTEITFERDDQGRVSRLDWAGQFKAQRVP